MNANSEMYFKNAIYDMLVNFLLLNDGECIGIGVFSCPFSLEHIGYTWCTKKSTSCFRCMCCYFCGRGSIGGRRWRVSGLDLWQILIWWISSTCLINKSALASPAWHRAQVRLVGSEISAFSTNCDQPWSVGLSLSLVSHWSVTQAPASHWLVGSVAWNRYELISTRTLPKSSPSHMFYDLETKISCFLSGSVSPLLSLLKTQPTLWLATSARGLTF